MNKVSKECLRAFMCALVVSVASLAAARTFEFKMVSSDGTVVRGNAYLQNSWERTKSPTSQSVILQVGVPLKTDSQQEIEIRAATVVRQGSSKNFGINDVASLRFAPINRKRAIRFRVTTGKLEHSTSSSSTSRSYLASSSSKWQVAGCIIELWQSGVLLKHWSSCPGDLGKQRLGGGVQIRQLKLNTSGTSFSSTSSYSSYSESFSNVTRINPLDANGTPISIEELMEEFRGAEGLSTSHQNPQGSAMPSEIKLESFCGYLFGKERPESEPAVFRMKTPFCHYSVLTPSYDEESKRLVGLSLRSSRSFASQYDGEMACAAAVTKLEEQYGIPLKGSSGRFQFLNTHLSVQLTATILEIRNLDILSEVRQIREKETVAGRKADTGMRYIVRRSDRVTLEDRRQVLENMRAESSFEVNYGNVLSRRFAAQQDLDDFKLVNPKALIFDTLADLKDFMRKVKFPDEESADEVQATATPTNNVVPANPVSVPMRRRRQSLTDEDYIRIETQHEQEMLKRKQQMQQRQGNQTPVE